MNPTLLIRQLSNGDLCTGPLRKSLPGKIRASCQKEGAGVESEATGLRAIGRDGLHPDRGGQALLDIQRRLRPEIERNRAYPVTSKRAIGRSVPVERKAPMELTG